MRTDVVVTRGRRQGRTGYIYGPLESRNPYVTKALVIFGPEDDAAIPLEHLAPIGRAPAQLELNLDGETADLVKTSKKARPRLWKPSAGGSVLEG